MNKNLLPQELNSFPAFFGGVELKNLTCSCGKPATVPVAIHRMWMHEDRIQSGFYFKSPIKKILNDTKFDFATAHNYHIGVSQAPKNSGYFVNLASCLDCCKKAQSMGLAYPTDNIFTDDLQRAGMFASVKWSQNS